MGRGLMALGSRRSGLGRLVLHKSKAGTIDVVKSFVLYCIQGVVASEENNNWLLIVVQHVCSFGCYE